MIPEQLYNEIMEACLPLATARRLFATSGPISREICTDCLEALHALASPIAQIQHPLKRSAHRGELLFEDLIEARDALIAAITAYRSVCSQYSLREENLHHKANVALTKWLTVLQGLVALQQEGQQHRTLAGQRNAI